MAPPNWYLGRTSRCFVGAGGNGLSTYGAAAVLAGTNAMRVTKVGITFDPHKYALSAQRYTDPSQRALLLRRFDAKFQVDALWYPSGVLNTVPESDTWLQNALGAGAPVNIVLATVFTGVPTTTGGSVSSATGLAIGQFVQITTGGKVYAAMLTNVATLALTWAPALPVAPTAGDACKGAITYKLATALPADIDLAAYPHAPSSGTPARELLGCVPDKLVIGIDSNGEPTFQISGPAQTLAGSSPNYTPQSEPGSWVTVGSESQIPSGMQTTFNYNGTIYQVTKIEETIENGMKQQNVAMGTNMATAMFRAKKRAWTMKATAMVSDDKTLWTPSVTAAQTAVPCLLQIGTVSGYIHAIYHPAVMVMAPPTIADSDEDQTWDFMLTAEGVNGNDEGAIGCL